jgi:hypothetical protein
MAGLVPAIHDFDFARLQRKTWMRGTSPRMTGEKQCVFNVMAGLVPAIHDFPQRHGRTCSGHPRLPSG